MGTLFGFVVGYVIGARSGSRTFDEVVDALRAIRDSEEFQALLDATRRHIRATARDLSARLASDEAAPAASEVIARARARFTAERT
jgi:phage shock protein A